MSHPRSRVIAAAVDALPLFSVCIPAYNEAALLPRLLRSIDVARSTFGRGENAVEVVVGDNQSTDDTAALARTHGACVVAVERRAIAAARNGAARAGRGEILCFIDADSIVHPQTFLEIAAVMATGRCSIGASGVKMERQSLGIFLTWLVLVPPTRLFQLDTGVVFCRREDFLAVGGYNEELPVAEDVDFMRRLKRHGRSTGRKFQRLPTARAITSTRKFDRHGDWHYLPMMLGLGLRFLFSTRERRRGIWGYWYNDR